MKFGFGKTTAIKAPEESSPVAKEPSIAKHSDSTHISPSKRGFACVPIPKSPAHERAGIRRNARDPAQSTRYLNIQPVPSSTQAPPPSLGGRGPQTHAAARAENNFHRNQSVLPHQELEGLAIDNDQVLNYKLFNLLQSFHTNQIDGSEISFGGRPTVISPSELALSLLSSNHSTSNLDQMQRGVSLMSCTKNDLHSVARGIKKIVGNNHATKFNVVNCLQSGKIDLFDQNNTRTMIAGMQWDIRQELKDRLSYLQVSLQNDAFITFDDARNNALLN